MNGDATGSDQPLLEPPSSWPDTPINQRMLEAFQLAWRNHRRLSMSRDVLFSFVKSRQPDLTEQSLSEALARAGDDDILIEVEDEVVLGAMPMAVLMHAAHWQTGKSLAERAREWELSSSDSEHLTDWFHGQPTAKTEMVELSTPEVAPKSPLGMTALLTLAASALLIVGLFWAFHDDSKQRVNLAYSISKPIERSAAPNKPSVASLIVQIDSPIKGTVHFMAVSSSKGRLLHGRLTLPQQRQYVLSDEALQADRILAICIVTPELDTQALKSVVEAVDFSKTNWDQTLVGLLPDNCTFGVSELMVPKPDAQ